MTPKRTLNIIEKLCYVWENSEKTIKQAQILFDEIYQYSHLYGNCKGKHRDWRRKMKRTEKELRNV